MKVVYHVHTYFLDNSLELINELKNQVDLHVLIEVSRESAKSTIIDIDPKELSGEIIDIKKLLTKESWSRMKEYFDRVQSCSAILYRGKNIFSIENIPTVEKLKKYIHSLKPDIVHFDTISNRCFWIYNSLKKYKLVGTIHDPLPHSGEGNWKQQMSRMFFERYATAYFFHSNYAEIIYRTHVEKNEKKTFQIGMKPFSIISKYLNTRRNCEEFILFFGRVSSYKGIDMLLKAIPKILQIFPEEVFMIVGRSDATIEKNIHMNLHHRVKYIDDYVSTEELANFIMDAKFVVCPYRDATQSGVLMTSFALNIPVVATNVGSFSEYIKDDYNGKLCNPEVDAISEAICNALENKRYLNWSDNLENKKIKTDSFENMNQYYQIL